MIVSNLVNRCPLGDLLDYLSLKVCQCCDCLKCEEFLNLYVYLFTGIVSIQDIYRVRIKFFVYLVCELTLVRRAGTEPAKLEENLKLSTAHHASHIYSTRG